MYGAASLSAYSSVGLTAAFRSQRLSVKLHLAVAYQIGQELGLAACRGADPRDDAC